METQAADAAAVTEGRPPMSLPARLGSIFYNPTAVMESINIQPTWVFVLALLTVVSLGFQYAVVHRIGIENIMLQGVKMNPMLAQKSEAELQEMASKAATSPFGVFSLYAGPIFMWIFVPLAAALLFLLAIMFGAEIPYKKFLSLLAHSFWMYTVGTSIVVLAVVFLISDPATIDLQNVVQANLGILFNKADNPTLYTLGSSLDMFSFWHLAVLALGISVFTHGRWSFGKSLLLPGLLWAIYVAGKAIIAFAFAK